MADKDGFNYANLTRDTVSDTVSEYMSGQEYLEDDDLLISGLTNGATTGVMTGNPIAGVATAAFTIGQGLLQNELNKDAIKKRQDEAAKKLETHSKNLKRQAQKLNLERERMNDKQFAIQRKINTVAKDYMNANADILYKTSVIASKGEFIAPSIRAAVGQNELFNKFSGVVDTAYNQFHDLKKAEKIYMKERDALFDQAEIAKQEAKKLRNKKRPSSWLRTAAIGLPSLFLGDD